MKCSVTFVMSVILVATISAAAQQTTWLDRQPITNWNTTSMRIPPADRRFRPQVQECKRTVRPATFAQDRALMQNGFWPVGSAQVYGATVVITAARDFDGMCRPNDFQVFVFDANRLIGTFSPELMNSRTDSAVAYVRMLSPTQFVATYSRYKADDPLCCPSRTQDVHFEISGNGRNAMLRPEGSDSGGTPVASTLAGTKWRWERLQTPVSNVTVSNPDNYTVEFLAGNMVNVRSDCNNGRGRYSSTGSDLTFSAIAMTRRACLRGSQDNLFNRSLAAARIYRRDGDKMYIDLFADGGTMHFTRIN